ncbi:MAG: MerR family transcriptional regulator [Acidobacteria bacterium]|nr:MerR family transcriptional regulator [Acidobacteriota bacterium]MDW7984189.1 MerR family transcriptional regulator [Acidobacteriota bacterium]
MVPETKPEDRTYRIAEVAERVGLPVSTIRFYLREFRFFLKTPRTPGGHRRFTDETIRQLLYLKYLIHTKGMALRDVQRRLLRGEDPQTLRQELNLLNEAVEALMGQMYDLRKTVQALQERLDRIEEDLRPSRGFKRLLG